MLISVSCYLSITVIRCDVGPQRTASMSSETPTCKPGDFSDTKVHNDMHQNLHRQRVYFIVIVHRHEKWVPHWRGCKLQNMGAPSQRWVPLASSRSRGTPRGCWISTIYSLYLETPEYSMYKPVLAWSDARYGCTIRVHNTGAWILCHDWHATSRIVSLFAKHWTT